MGNFLNRWHLDATVASRVCKFEYPAKISQNFASKSLIIAILLLVIFSGSGCKSFKQYFDTPPRQRRNDDKKPKVLTPAEERRNNLRRQTFSNEPDNKPLKTNIGSSLNGYEKSYINKYYKENDARKSKHNVFKIF